MKHILTLLLIASTSMAQESMDKEYQEFQEYKKWKSAKEQEYKEDTFPKMTEEPSAPQQATIPKPEEKPTEPTQTIPEAPKWRFTFGAGLMLTTSDIEAKNGKIYNSTGSVNVSTSATVTRANSLFIEVGKLQKFGWGAHLGAKYEFERETETITVTGGGSTVSAKGGGKSQVTTFYGNAVYQWDQFYLPFGLNTSQVNPKGDSDPSVYSRIEPDLGMQLGIGLNINENLSGELVNWLFAAKQIIKSNGTTFDLGRYTASSMVIALKYLF